MKKNTEHAYLYPSGTPEYYLQLHHLLLVLPRHPCSPRIPGTDNLVIENPLNFSLPRVPKTNFSNRLKGSKVT